MSLIGDSVTVVDPLIVGVGVYVGVTVGVLVGSGVGVLVGVAVGVSVGVAVAVGVGVTVGDGVLVAVAVAVGVGVGGSGVAVSVGVGVAVGETNVIEPLVVVVGSVLLAVSVSVTADSATDDTPSATVPNWIVVKTPMPFGPAVAPIVLQPNVTVFAPVVGAGQVTVRPVEPRNEPLVALTKVRTVASQVTV